MKSKINKGIIYRIYNAGAYDKVINLLNENGAKTSGLVKGVRKANSRKAASINLGNYIEIKNVEGYAVPIITEVKLLDEFLNWKKDYDAMLMLQLACEIVDKFAYPDTDDSQIFEIFYNLLTKKDLERIEYLIAVFTLKLLSISGNLPNLTECSETGETLKSETAYVAPGILGYVCKSANVNVQKISPRIYKTQRFILEHNSDKFIKVDLTRKEDLEMLRLHLDWIELSLDHELKSKDIVLSLINKKYSKI